MTSNQDTIISLVLAQMKPGDNVDEDAIRKLVNFFKQLNNITPEEEQEVIHELHSILSVRMDVGACVSEKHLPWYDAAKKEIEQTYWNRYRRYLQHNEGFNSDVINALDASTDRMMDMLENPNSPYRFSRKGLVIGDVQSGKTSTYTALINKAADARYKIIILLTGTIEKLRRQTQGRLDEGFVGLDSTAFTRDKNNVVVGVGRFDQSVSGWAVTSTSKDFNTAIARQLNGKLSSIKDPILFVLKKNKSVLEKLEQWLRIYNGDPQNENTISIPMLLIDDEADNASVNTKKEDDSPTAINAGIRKLLRLFTKANYVGFTATPYANIFINPDSDDEMLNDDLFPRDFIYALEAPTNYIGARSIFAEDGKYHFMLKNNDDCEEYIPVKHNKEYHPGTIPESLKEAIVSFFIANAIRDLRGHNKKHRSMLVNVSRFIDVQNRIAQQLDGFVRDFRREIELYSKMGVGALKHDNIQYVKHVYDKHFAPLNNRLEKEDEIDDWDRVLEALSEAIAPIVVRSVNGGNAAKNLNYDENEEEGLRLIAVGGVSLSRGLTLEGLCVSYYHRNTKMYDTLMQMGRWFGYRPHYADVCQVWMSEDSASWYEYISEASDELRREVRKMGDLGLTPKDFGLGVRSDKDALLVTAINKMRNTEQLTQSISLAGEVVETPYFYLDKKTNEDNSQLIETWISELLDAGYSFADNEKEDLALRNNPQLLNIPKEKVLELLQSYKSHYRNIHFRPNDLVQLIKKYTDDTVDHWDVVIATGSGSQRRVCNKEIKVMQRSFDIVEDSKGQDAIRMNATKARLGTNNLSRGGLSKAKLNLIKEKTIDMCPSTDDPDRELTANEYFRTGIVRNPLLTIYPVQIMYRRDEKKSIDERIESITNEYSEDTLYGLSVGIPSINGRKKETYNYIVNMIKWKEQYIVDAEEDIYEETGVDDDDYSY